MERIRKIFTSRQQHQNQPQQQNESRGRSFENPHRTQSPCPATPIYSEFTPGLGRKVPELLAAGGGFFEIHYKNNYERRLDWAYSPETVPHYKIIKGKYKNRKEFEKAHVFCFDKEQIESLSLSDDDMTSSAANGRSTNKEMTNCASTARTEKQRDD